MTHRPGKGPKDVFVGAYPRWKRGRRERVSQHTRGTSHKLGFRASPFQLDFGF
jgi:hypothetical protein